MIDKLLDPKTDFAFKHVFGNEKNKGILIHFLNDVLQVANDSQIKEVEFLNSIQDAESLYNKQSIVDVICQDEQGKRYIVEMQVVKDRGFEKRAQYYASKAYISQMKTGGKYEDLKEVIFLALTDFIMFPDSSEYKCDHVILDKVDFSHKLKDLSFTFIELPKFTKNFLLHDRK